MSENFPSDGVTADLELAETKLRVVDGELQRLNEKGGVAMRIALPSINRIEFQTRFDKGFFLFFGGAVGLALIGAFVSQSNVMTCILYAFSLLVILFGIGGCRDRVIVIVTDDELLDVINRDSKDMLDGFVSSLRKMIVEIRQAK